jgi:oligopeptide transport system ATP-binding protein
MRAHSEFVLETKNICKTYQQGRWWQQRFSCRALQDVSLALRAGATLAIMGESGSGKTTLAMCLVGLERVDSGKIFFDGTDLATLPEPARGATRRQIQLIFQDSVGALNPRMSAAEIVEEPLLIQAKLMRRKLSSAEMSAVSDKVLEQVGISSNWKRRQPHEFSGGQRQRLAIARALVVKPKALILDEIFVGLDLSMQGQIANLLLELQQTQGLSYLCISHDEGLAHHIADEIVVMDRGQIVERTNLGEVPTKNLTSQVTGATARSAHSGA